jgi:hypothetical protein
LTFKRDFHDWEEVVDIPLCSTIHGIGDGHVIPVQDNGRSVLQARRQASILKKVNGNSITKLQIQDFDRSDQWASEKCTHADTDFAMVPAAPPTLKNHLATSWPAPISAKDPYLHTNARSGDQCSSLGFKTMQTK